jgi:mono/diheme cytochrome c family protein
MKRSTIVFCGLAALLIAAIGCSDVKRTPGKAYMPDMANSRAYETYSVNPVFADGRTSQGPVAGTVKRGDEYPVHIEMDNIGDTVNYYASRSLPNPVDSLDADQMKETERLYLINCGICHGAKPDGQMFYSITYGKNLMGGYASQITAKQRWEIITYIKSKQGK